MQNLRAGSIYTSGLNVVSSYLNSSTCYSFVIHFYTSNIVLDEQVSVSVPVDKVRLVTHPRDPYR